MSWPRPTSTMLVDQVLARYRPRRANRVSSSPSACTAPTRSVSASSSAEPQRRVDGVPRAAQFRRDVCERAAPARLTGRPTRRATRQQRPRRRDLLCLLADIARLAALISAAPSALVPHQRRGPAQRREVHQLHPPLAVGPQRPATAPAQRPRRPAPDMNPQRRALFVFNAEHLHVSESHDQLAHASRVIFHRDPPASVVFDSTDSGGSLAFNRGCPRPPLRSNSRRANKGWPKHAGNEGLPIRLGHGNHVVDQRRCGEIGDLVRLRWDHDLSPRDVSLVTGGVPPGSPPLRPSASPRFGPVATHAISSCELDG